jgi:hypothetical protein
MARKQPKISLFMASFGYEGILYALLRHQVGGFRAASVLGILISAAAIVGLLIFFNSIE